MSFDAIRRALQDTRAREPASRHVLLILANFADKDGAHVYPSLPTISRLTGWALSSVRRAMRDLEQLGVIKVTERIPGKATQYTITTPPTQTGVPQSHTVGLERNTPVTQTAPPRSGTLIDPGQPDRQSYPESSHINLRSARASSPDGLALARQGAPERPSRASEAAPEFIVTREGKDAFKAKLAVSNPADIERRRREAAAIVEREMAKRTGL